MWESFRRNTTKRTRQFLVLFVVAVIAVLIVSLVLRLKEHGDGTLFTDFNANANQLIEENKHDETDNQMTIIRIETEAIFVDDHLFSFPDEAYEEIKKAADKGHDFQIIDDYASARNYNAVMSFLHELNIEEARIDTKEEP